MLSYIRRMDATSWMADYQRRIGELESRARRAQDALRTVSATASSANGAVTVTVEPDGGLRQLIFTERADELTRPRLADAVLDAVRRARADVARNTEEALRPLLGEASQGRPRP